MVEFSPACIDHLAKEAPTVQGVPMEPDFMAHLHHRPFQPNSPSLSCSLHTTRSLTSLKRVMAGCSGIANHISVASATIFGVVRAVSNRRKA